MGKPLPIIILGIIVLIVVFAWYTVPRTISVLSQPPRDMLMVGVNTPFPPFEYMIGDRVVGFDIDLAGAIADKLNRKLVIKDFSDFAAIFPAVETGSIDMAISGITITSERSEVVNFSDPYYNASQAVLIARNSKFKASGNITAKDFEGFIVGYQELTTSQTWVESNLYGKVNMTNITFGDFGSGLQQLRLGAIDVIVLDKPVADTFARNYEDLTVTGTIDTSETYGVIVGENDPEKILPKINDVIKQMKENGEYDKLIKKHFGGGNT
jgi:ABC-type amino acid transport substrate-binding protein